MTDELVLRTRRFVQKCLLCGDRMAAVIKDWDAWPDWFWRCKRGGERVTVSERVVA